MMPETEMPPRGDDEAPRLGPHQIAAASARARRARDKSNAFRLLDLPAELRTLIYQHYLQECQSSITGYTNFMILPALCSASRKVREEFRPLFFAETTFSICVGSNLEIFRDQRLNSWQKYGTQFHRHLESRDSGLLCLSDRSQRIFDGAGKDALMRRVRLVVYNSRHMRQIWEDEIFEGGFAQMYESRRSWISFSEGRPAAVLILYAPAGGSLQSSQEHGSLAWGQPPYHSGDPAYEIQDVEAALHQAKQIARGISQQEDFEGFSMADLRLIATALRI